MTFPRRMSAADGGRPLGLDPGGLRVEGLLYHEIKHALELLQPSEPAKTSRTQREFVGGEPSVADFTRPGPGGWRQPAQLPVWSPPEDLDVYDEPSDDMRIVLSAETVADLQALMADEPRAIDDLEELTV